MIIESSLLRLLHYSRYYFFALFLFFSLIPLVFAFFCFSDHPNPIDGLGNFKYILAFFIAPFFETLIFQHVPVAFCTRLKIYGIFRLLICIGPFMLAHFSQPSSFLQILNGFSGGLILGTCYIICAKISFRYAFVMTFILHSFHNVVAMTLVFL